ncbi:MAG: hypothetical protein JWM80_5364 [Cyanobacteria bacterium RYN_339]|nr:hypothetical protein [Cyanobacteria bacterium RYN_339]
MPSRQRFRRRSWLADNQTRHLYGSHRRQTGVKAMLEFGGSIGGLVEFTFPGGGRELPGYVCRAAGAGLWRRRGSCLRSCLVPCGLRLHRQCRRMGGHAGIAAGDGRQVQAGTLCGNLRDLLPRFLPGPSGNHMRQFAAAGTAGLCRGAGCALGRRSVVDCSLAQRELDPATALTGHPGERCGAIAAVAASGNVPCCDGLPALARAWLQGHALAGRGFARVSHTARRKLDVLVSRPTKKKVHTLCSP